MWESTVNYSLSLRLSFSLCGNGQRKEAFLWWPWQFFQLFFDSTLLTREIFPIMSFLGQGNLIGNT